MVDYRDLGGRGEWLMESSTGDAVLLVNDTVVARVTGAGVATVTTLNAALTGNVTGNLSGATVATTGVTSTTSGVGAIGAQGTLVAEEGNSAIHVTHLTFTKTQAVSGAALSFGAALYTLPAVPCLILGASIDGTITGTAEASTPETGIGTTIGSGANSALSAVGAGAENIITGTAAAGAVSTGVAADIVSGSTLLPTVVAASSVLYANIASTWTATESIVYAGTVRVAWIELI